MRSPHINLIPVDRRRAARCRTRIRAWLVIGTTYALFLVVATLVVRLVWSFDNGALEQELAEVTSARNQNDLDVIRLKRQIRQLRADVEANRAVSDQADWSILLALLAAELDDQIVLRRCQLSMPRSQSGTTQTRPGSTDDAGDESQEPVVRSLQLSGLGLSQGAVAQFVLRLEQTSLFREVTQAETRREPFREHHAVAFRIECIIETSGSTEAAR